MSPWEGAPNTINAPPLYIQQLEKKKRKKEIPFHLFDFDQLQREKAGSIDDNSFTLSRR